MMRQSLPSPASIDPWERQRPKDSANPNQHPTMTLDLATSLLNRAADGDQLLMILETIAADAEQGTATDFDGTPIIW
jgi:hypothetical protein